MDAGSGHIYNCDKIDMENIKGELVLWEVGEEIEVKGCKFKVKEINIFPKDEIILIGIPKCRKTLIEELSEEIPEVDDNREPSQVMRDFIRNKK